MKFTPEDFEEVHCEECAYIAHEIANAKLQGAPTVKKDGMYSEWPTGVPHKFTAKLVCIEEIK